jgi:hypothetical protein
MNYIKDKAIKVKNHVVRNKVTYAVGAVAVAAIALQQSNKNAFYKFLETKGIDPQEYYYPEGFAEKSA